MVALSKQFQALFVDKYKWIDGQMVCPVDTMCHSVRRVRDCLLMLVVQYQELFALCQALPGPGSTKMIYCINFIHAGFLPGIVSFFIWRRVQQHSSHTDRCMRI